MLFDSKKDSWLTDWSKSSGLLIDFSVDTRIGLLKCPSLFSTSISVTLDIELHSCMISETRAQEPEIRLENFVLSTFFRKNPLLFWPAYWTFFDPLSFEMVKWEVPICIIDFSTTTTNLLCAFRELFLFVLWVTIHSTTSCHAWCSRDSRTDG